MRDFAGRQQWRPFIFRVNAKFCKKIFKNADFSIDTSFSSDYLSKISENNSNIVTDAMDSNSSYAEYASNVMQANSENIEAKNRGNSTYWSCVILFVIIYLSLALSFSIASSCLWIANSADLILSSAFIRFL